MISQKIDKLLIISGPTSAGKTKLALEIAKEIPSELVSVDSRQVYQGMDIGTGKDIPIGAKWSKSSIKFKNYSLGYYQTNDTKIWGYDIVSPLERFSSAQFCRIANLIIDDIFSRNKLPIVVGGTGRYLQDLINPPETLTVPINEILRQKLAKLNIAELQLKAKQCNLKRYTSLNNSDSNNPRRLIRLIEVSQSKNELLRANSAKNKVKLDQILWLGIKIKPETLQARISQRVQSRIKAGFVNELQALDSEEFWSSSASSAIGYRQFRDYLDKKITLENAVESWINEEIAYAKRQMTWFKKNDQIYWIDSEDSDRASLVERIKTWYS